MEPLGVGIVILAPNEAESIGAVVAELPRDIVHEIIVVDGGSSVSAQ
jgi:glycosyltransferase involved in cell wall biosynthesis